MGSRRQHLCTALVVLLGPFFACSEETGTAPPSTIQRILIRLENIAPAEGIINEFGAPYDPTFAPGAWAVHGPDTVLLALGASATPALETVAERGDPRPLRAEFEASGGTRSTGLAQALSEVDYSAASLASGGSLEFVISARSEDRLTLAFMFIQTNDSIVATPEGGLSLFDAQGQLIVGNRAEALDYWDVGTEQNEQPGFGENQPERQVSPDAGAPENGVVSRVVDNLDIRSHHYPALGTVLRLTMVVAE